MSSPMFTRQQQVVPCIFPDLVLEEELEKSCPTKYALLTTDTCTKTTNRQRPVDPVSLEPIPESQLIRLRINGVLTCYNVNTLIHIVKDAHVTNTPVKEPLSRYTFTTSQVSRIMNFASLRDRRSMFKVSLSLFIQFLQKIQSLTNTTTRYSQDDIDHLHESVNAFCSASKTWWVNRWPVQNMQLQTDVAWRGHAGPTPSHILISLLVLSSMLPIDLMLTTTYQHNMLLVLLEPIIIDVSIKEYEAEEKYDKFKISDF